MYLDGKTQGKPWHALPVDNNNPTNERAWKRIKYYWEGSWNNCPHADKMRLRRLPKSLMFSDVQLTREHRKQWRAILGYHRRWLYRVRALECGTLTFEVL